MVYVVRWLKQNFILITYENISYDKIKISKIGVEHI